MIQYIGDIWKSTFPDLIESNKLDTSIIQKFTDILVALPILSDKLDEELSESSSRDLYTLCRMNLVADPGNIPALQFVDLGLSTMNALDKGASLFTPATKGIMPTNVAHGRAVGHTFGITTVVRDELRSK